MNLRDRYRIDDAQVDRSIATDLESGRRVVVKELTLGRIRDWKELELFRRESETLAQLDHPGIPSFVDSFEGDGASPTYFLVYEHVEGVGPLDAALDSDGVRDVVTKLLQTLKYLQSFSPPVLHRNITPDHVRITQEREVYLTDFGQVQVELDSTVGGSTLVGTSGYMAPEQLLGRAVPASDVFGVGALAVELLTGTCPADLELHRMKLQWRHLANCDDDRFLDWIDRMVEPNPADRFQSAAEALRAWGTGISRAGMLAQQPRETRIELRRTDRSIRATLPGQRLPNVLSLIATVILLVVTLGNPFGSAPFVAGMLVSGAFGYASFMEMRRWTRNRTSVTLEIDVDRGYRVASNARRKVDAGPFKALVSAESGYRGERDSLWLSTQTEMIGVMRGLTDHETSWLRDEINALIRQNRR